MTISDNKLGTNSNKVWATLITNSNYLPGVLTLNYSLIKSNSNYPLIALHTSKLDAESLKILKDNNIPTLLIQNLNPGENKSVEPRFVDTWSKLYFFKLTQFKRIIQLDSDMLILQNIDELMDLNLNGYKFASTHACVCNPLNFSNYPENWCDKNCVYSDHLNINLNKSIYGPHCSSGLSKLNSGILIVDPDMDNFNKIKSKLSDNNAVNSYIFPDQDLLADLFYNDWLAISQYYNTLKTFKNCHPTLWNLSKIKNIHFILSPKPWDVNEGNYVDDTGTFKLWWDFNNERIRNTGNN